MHPLGPSDPLQVGPFRIVARLGSGAMGTVYLGMSPTADKVAVKIMRTGADEFELRKRFAAEAASLRRVHGSRIARFEGAGIDHGVPWLAVEYVPGNSLRQHVDLHGRTSPALTAMLGAQLADGLGKVHDAGLLHRDLKPQNILLGPDGPKVIDFGVSRLFEDSADQLTLTGTVVGTPAYMPPEQARADRDLTPAADIYSLAATLALSATGRPLYPDVSGHQLVLRICDPNAHPDLRPLPDALRPLLSAMLSYDPRHRPSLREVEMEFLRIVDAFGPREQLRAALIRATAIPEPALTPPDSDPSLLVAPPAGPADPDRSLLQRLEPPPEQRKRRGLRPWLTGGVLLLIAAVAGLAVVVSQLAGEEPDPVADPSSTTPPPTSSAASTTSTAAPQPQIVLRGVQDNGTSVKLRWTARPGWYYTVVYVKQGTSKSKPKPAGRRGNYTVTGLDKKALYCFRVVGTLALGSGQPTQTAQSEMKGVRGAVCARGSQQGP